MIPMLAAIPATSLALHSIAAYVGSFDFVGVDRCFRYASYASWNFRIALSGDLGSGPAAMPQWNNSRFSEKQAEQTHVHSGDGGRPEYLICRSVT